MKQYYPMMIDLQDRPCIVIGGGKVAFRKITNLIEASAIVTVISPAVTGAIEELSALNKITWEKRSYLKGDLQGFFLVIIATDNPAINQEIYQDINHSLQLVNIVDSPELCTFIVPASFQRGHLQIAISTYGASPGFAKVLKEQLAEQFGEEYVSYTQFLADMRSWVLKQNIQKEHRKKIFRQLLQEEYFQMVINGDGEKIKQELSKLIAALN